ncbi:aspartate/glutamate racemase family protein [Corynebacterium halotolerans]|uniref:aspartate/glutamate racemase family protein n=1 Tax=Corynebacterium halotolerans TaxID=225326 RepID=UPI003CE8D996
MKRLGLVGGTGPESTVVYYRALIASVQERLGPEALPAVTIDSLSPFEVFRYLRADDVAGLTEYLLASVNRLVAAGAEVVSLSASTTHIVYDRLVEQSPVPMISAVDATRDAVRARGMGHVVLLGTSFTMNNDFLAQPLRDAGITVSLPEPDEIDWMQECIEAELEHGVVKETTRQEFIGVLGRLKAQGAEGVILGCTELPLLLDDESSPLPCIDTAGVHAAAITREILADH